MAAEERMHTNTEDLLPVKQKADILRLEYLSLVFVVSLSPGVATPCFCFIFLDLYILLSYVSAFNLHLCLCAMFVPEVVKEGCWIPWD